ncbi:hypothetical protein FOMPIDRAFT_86730 [Fomitopsis schrenkii]|uniref:ABC transmembrane type-1 domain-containing protein n=1 Tax=Fomitopsis schrenkii TaxID=2126942 RepID=S8FXE6_FOMSC|nr:hypothetical protein FOMPIDRAFT_86730 [Fomitopsis schrenkii]
MSISPSVVLSLTLAYEATRTHAPLVLAAYIANLAATVTLLLLVFNKLLVGVPSDAVEQDKIGQSVSPEDYNTLWGWMHFTLILPLVERGTKTTLSESDIWALSPTVQARPLCISRTLRHTVFRWLWAANSLDLTFDFMLTYRILHSLDQHTHPISETRALASIYAILAFLSTLCKAQSDVQHLWFGPTCIRSELMAAIFDKALKRKGISGLVDQNPEAAEVKGSPKVDDRKAVADMGKIVNFMAGDANRISQIVASSYFIYGASFKIMIALTFLYQLLGLSPFAGFIDLFDAQPALRCPLARLPPQLRAHVRQRRIQLCEPFIRLVHPQFPRPTHASDPEKRVGPTVNLAAIVLLGADLNMMLAVPNDAAEKAMIVRAPVLEC